MESPRGLEKLAVFHTQYLLLLIFAFACRTEIYLFNLSSYKLEMEVEHYIYSPPFSNL